MQRQTPRHAAQRSSSVSYSERTPASASVRSDGVCEFRRKRGLPRLIDRPLPSSLLVIIITTIIIIIIIIVSLRLMPAAILRRDALFPRAFSYSFFAHAPLVRPVTFTAYCVSRLRFVARLDSEIRASATREFRRHHVHFHESSLLSTRARKLFTFQARILQ